MVLDLKEARGRILAGEVIVNDKRVDKVGQMVPEAAPRAWAKNEPRSRQRGQRIPKNRGSQTLLETMSTNPKNSRIINASRGHRTLKIMTNIVFRAE